jgi:nucleoside-diphosphate-sugar epimerase
MRVFIAGATGVIGRQLVPMLLKEGHEVTGTTRTEHGLAQLKAQGAKGVLVDVFDRDDLASAVGDARPDAVIHQLTALSGGTPVDNARLRRTGTRNLVDAAKQAGVPRIVAQSIAWAYEPGDIPADEKTPLDLNAGEPRATTIGGVHALEIAVSEIGEHVILRYGLLYGPGTWYAPGARVEKQLRGGDLVATEAVSSFVHVTDAARAAVLALEWPSGAVNVVDDEPASAQQWMPVLSDAFDAPAPKIEAGRGRWERGADNTFARTELGWQPAFPSWRSGFAAQES